MKGKSVEFSEEADPGRWSSLMAQVAQRDELAFEKLYSETKAAVFGFAMRILRDRAEAEETCMDVYLKAWEEAGRYSPERGAVLTWLLVMTRSKALDRIRRKAARPSNWLDLDEIQIAAAPGTEPDSIAAYTRMKDKVVDVLFGLPKTHRAAVELALYEGMSHSEIAARLEQPIGTVKTRIRSAMVKIRNEVSAL
jgi:RNA polymerase sigma-70 factor (ECF subfamily)